jgi:hypothetical protein
MTWRHPLERELRDAYRFPGFIPRRTIRGLFGDPQARVVPLTRRAKKQSAGPVARRIVAGTIGANARSAICRAAISGSISSSICGASTAGGVVA